MLNMTLSTTPASGQLPLRIRGTGDISRLKICLPGLMQERADYRVKRDLLCGHPIASIPVHAVCKVSLGAAAPDVVAPCADSARGSIGHGIMYYVNEAIDGREALQGCRSQGGIIGKSLEWSMLDLLASSRAPTDELVLAVTTTFHGRRGGYPRSSMS